MFANFLFFPALSQHISYHLLNRKSISPELNNTTVHSSLSPLWFLVVLPGARSPGEPGQTYLLILFPHLCAHEFIAFNKNPFTNTEHSKNFFYCFFLSPLVSSPLFPLFAARSPGETKVNLRRDTTTSLPSLSLFFLSIPPSVCLFVTRTVLNSNDANSRKTSAVCSLCKETNSNNANLTGGRAFAVSVLFTCQSSGLSYPLVSLFVGRSFQPVEHVVSPCFVFWPFTLTRLLYFAHRVIIYPSRKCFLTWTLCSTFVFCSPLCSKISRWARVTWEEMQKSLYHSYFNPSLNELLWKYFFFFFVCIFCLAVQLVCSAVSV